MTAVAVPSLQELRRRCKTLIGIAMAHGATNLRITGSVAYGQEGADSDVDFMVDLETGRDVADLGELARDLEDELGCPVDVGPTPPAAAWSRGLMAAAIPIDGDVPTLPPVSEAHRHRQRLRGTLRNADQIAKYIDMGRDGNLGRDLIYAAVLGGLSDLARNVRRLPPESRSRHSEVRWRAFEAFATVARRPQDPWTVAERYLPALIATLRAELDVIGPG